MNGTDLDDVEARLLAILDRYRPELIDGTIYGLPSLVLPGAKGHDYFVALKRAKKHVGLYLIIADRYPEDLEPCTPELIALRTGRATYSFSTLSEELAADLTALLDRLLIRYRAEHR